MKDEWSKGFRAGLNGATYSDNPNDSTAWAFGCSEGMRERNRQAMAAIISVLSEESEND